MHHRLLLLHCVRLHTIKEAMTWAAQQDQLFVLWSFGIFFKDKGERWNSGSALCTVFTPGILPVDFNLDQCFKSLQNKLLLSVKSSQNQSQSICIDLRTEDWFSARKMLIPRHTHMLCKAQIDNNRNTNSAVKRTGTCKEYMKKKTKTFTDHTVGEFVKLSAVQTHFHLF